MSTQAPEKFEFQAEVKQVLDIVVHSLYTDKEIFIRELVSNASDALEKLRHTQLTEKDIFDSKLDLEIKISNSPATEDKPEETKEIEKDGKKEIEVIPATVKSPPELTIQDFGIGMTRDELIENLGTIAHSGSKAFLEAIKDAGSNNENLIGQFGVGFYSVFMVADAVKVYTRSWQQEAPCLCWTSDGSGSYTIDEVEGERRGTKIVITLKDEFKEFAEDYRVKSILEKYSSYIEFPVMLNDEKINTAQAIWLKSKSDITEEEYKEFYKFQAKAFDEPIDWMHFSVDAPLAINSLLYIPTTNPEIMGMGRGEPAVALHCRKILIDSSPKSLLPEWMRFIKGVIDSADLPLNISRESMQDSALMQKLNSVISKRFVKYLGEIAKKDNEKYQKIWNTFGVYLKEGISSDFTHRESLAPLLRYESSATEKGKFTHLTEYVDRMKEGQDAIYYLVGPNRESIESGPYLEAFKARSIEVLFLYEPIDDFVMSNLTQFKDKKLTSADQNDLNLGDSTVESEGEALPEDEVKAVCDWLRETLGKDKVVDVATGDRLVDSPAIALNADKFMTANMKRIMKVMSQQKGEPQEEAPSPVNLQINPKHTLIKNLVTLKDSDKETAALLAEQIYDNALISAGLLEDPRKMISRLHKLMEKVSS